MTRDEALNFIRAVKSGEKSEREAIEFLRDFLLATQAAPRSTLSAPCETARAR